MEDILERRVPRILDTLEGRKGVEKGAEGRLIGSGGANALDSQVAEGNTHGTRPNLRLVAPTRTDHKWIEG